MNAIDSNVNFCITLDTLDMKPINRNLSLIAVTVNGFHVESVKSNAKN